MLEASPSSEERDSPVGSTSVRTTVLEEAAPRMAAVGGDGGVLSTAILGGVSVERVRAHEPGRQPIRGGASARTGRALLRGSDAECISILEQGGPHSSGHEVRAVGTGRRGHGWRQLGESADGGDALWRERAEVREVARRRGGRGRRSRDRGGRGRRVGGPRRQDAGAGKAATAVARAGHRADDAWRLGCARCPARRSVKGSAGAGKARGSRSAARVPDPTREL